MKIEATDIDSTGADAGAVPTSDGSGGVAWVVPSSGGSLPSSQASMSANLVLTGTYADLPGMSLSLAAGTWLVIAVVEANPGGTNTMFAKIRNDTAGVDLVATSRGAPSGHTFAVPLSTIVTLGATSTVKVQARHDASSMTALSLVDSIPASYISAIRIA